MSCLDQNSFNLLAKLRFETGVFELVWPPLEELSACPPARLEKFMDGQGGSSLDCLPLSPFPPNFLDRVRD